MEVSKKYVPFVGEHLYVCQLYTDGRMSTMKTPYTVESVKGNVCTVREAKCLFYGVSDFDFLPDKIVDVEVVDTGAGDTSARRMKLRWSEKHQRWQESSGGGCPRVAVFGKWDYQSYLD